MGSEAPPPSAVAAAEGFAFQLSSFLISDLLLITLAE